MKDPSFMAVGENIHPVVPSCIQGISKKRYITSCIHISVADCPTGLVRTSSDKVAIYDCGRIFIVITEWVSARTNATQLDWFTAVRAYLCCIEFSDRYDMHDNGIWVCWKWLCFARAVGIPWHVAKHGTTKSNNNIARITATEDALTDLMECLLSVNVSFSPVVSAVSWQADIECPGQIVQSEQLLLSIFRSFGLMGLESWHF
jgi:hypothetical protein